MVCEEQDTTQSEGEAAISSDSDVKIIFIIFFNVEFNSICIK